MPAATGVFTLEELLALGQTGDAKKDWLAQKPGESMFIGGEHIMLPTDIPAGYYNLGVPGEATYVDVQSGSVPREFVDFFNAGKLERDPFSNAPLSFIDPHEDRITAPQIDPTISKELIEQFRLEASGLSRQEAQDKRLAAQQAAIPWPNTPAARPTDFDPAAKTGAYAKFIASGGTDAMLGASFPREAEDPAKYAEIRDSLAANYMRQSEALRGLGEVREARGLDPITGTSEAEKKRIYGIYQSISDPAQKEYFVSMQDPGNLIPELRGARQAARAGERGLLGQNQPSIEYGRVYEGDRSAQYVLKRGDVTQTDPETGREHVYGGVPLSAEMIRPKYRLGEDIMRRVGGGVMGAGMGLVTGNLAGAVLGAYSGAGGPMPQVKGAAGGLFQGMLNAALGYMAGGAWGAVLGGASGTLQGGGGVRGLKKGRWGDFEGFGAWKAGSPTVPGGRELGTAILFGEIMKRGSGGAKTGRIPLVNEGVAWA